MKSKNIVLSGLFLALGLVMPFITGQIPSIGSRLLPMHIPVLLCGFICGWPYGLIVGFVTPLFRSMIFGMPPIMPIGVTMAFELAAYGFLTGVLFKWFPQRTGYIYLTLVLSMLFGRIIWGISSIVLYGINGTSFNFKIFISGALLNAIPGIIIQLIIIPFVIITLKNTRLIKHE